MCLWRANTVRRGEKSRIDWLFAGTIAYGRKRGGGGGLFLRRHRKNVGPNRRDDGSYKSLSSIEVEDDYHLFVGNVGHMVGGAEEK